MDLLDLFFTEIDGLPEANNALKNYRVVRDIYERDPGIMIGEVLYKERARKELAFIYFCVKKDYYDTAESEKDRWKLIKKRLDMPMEWEPDELILEAIEILKEDTTTKQDKLLTAASEVADDFLDFFREIRESNKETLADLRTKKKDITDEEEFKKIVEKQKRAEELLEKHVKYTKDMSFVIAELDKLKALRKDTLKKVEKQQLSELEKSKSTRYERRGNLWDLQIQKNSLN